MKIPDNFAPVLDYIRRHLGNEMVSNERLVLFTAAAVAIVWFSALYGLWGATSHMRAQLNTAKTSLARIQAEVTGDAWPKRGEEVRLLKTQLASRLWEAPTAGLAEASFETWLRARINESGGEAQQIQITRSAAMGRDGQAAPALAGVQRMTAKILTNFEPTATVNFLAGLVEADKVMVVDRLIVRAGANSRLEMDVSTFVRTADARPPAKDKP